ncbi:MAG: Hpt domain-containing protein [Desulfobacterales bacterium]|nr:Hpt domain-containing protein [Desulfobacterales bacterium]
MNDKELAQKIIQVFLKTIPNNIGRLEKYIVENKISEMDIEAHNIKGASANIKAERLRAVAADIEKFGKDMDSDGAKRLLPKLKEEFEILKKVLEMFIHNKEE